MCHKRAALRGPGHVQAHGNATAYAFMLDADFVVKEPWRLRITAQRMVAECRERSVEECGKGMKVLPPGAPACCLELLRNKARDPMRHPHLPESTRLVRVLAVGNGAA